MRQRPQSVMKYNGLVLFNDREAYFIIRIDWIIVKKKKF